MEKRCSSLRKLLRVSMYVLKLKVWNQLGSDMQRKFQKHKLLSSIFDVLKIHGSITHQEVKMASLLWVSFIQHKRYGDIFVAIKKKKQCLQMQLGIKMDDFEVLRCYGRYSNADLNRDKIPKTTTTW